MKLIDILTQLKKQKPDATPEEIYATVIHYSGGRSLRVMLDEFYRELK